MVSSKNNATLLGGVIFGACGRTRTGDRWLWVRMSDRFFPQRGNVSPGGNKPRKKIRLDG